MVIHGSVTVKKCVNEGHRAQKVHPLNRFPIAELLAVNDNSPHVDHENETTISGRANGILADISWDVGLCLLA